MDYYKEIKNELVDIQVYKKVKEYSVNKYELEKYYNVGKLLVDAQGGENRAKYGDSLIKEYSQKLSEELGKGFTFTVLTRMRKFYLISQKVATVSQLSWSHYVEVLKIEDINEINYYINISMEQHLSVRELRERIKNNEYERLSVETRNKIINHVELDIKDTVKHPIIIKNTTDSDLISEKILKELILNDLDDFLKQLGMGYCYIGNEYKIKVGNKNNYIDILLFNIEYNCYVVVELKVRELDKRDIGQIQIYMGYIDTYVKKINQNKTIGVIISKKDNEYIIKYSSNEDIISTTYELV